MGQAIGGIGSKIFGSTDGLNAAGGALGQGANADQLGIGGGQLFARQALKGGLGALGKGLGQQQQQPQGMAPPINAPQAPMVDPSYFGIARPKNPFYGS